MSCSLFASQDSQAYTCLISGTLCVNNVAPNRASLGRINGMAQSLGSLSRAIGPVMSSSLFAFSLEHPKILGGQLIWLCLFSVSRM